MHPDRLTDSMCVRAGYKDNCAMTDLLNEALATFDQLFDEAAAAK